MSTVTIEADRLPANMRAVEARRRQGIGRFLTADVLDKERDRDFATLVAARFPGIRVVTLQNGEPHFVSTRGGCRIQVYLDDIPFGAVEDIWMIKTWDLAAVEYYPTTQVPAAYRTRMAGCGLLLAWSKWL